MRVVVTGAAGLLGAAIVREFERTSPATPGSEARVVAFARTDLDITDADAVARAVHGARPDVVINCAAYNDVDGAEDDPGTAIRTNSVAVGVLSGAARRAGAAFVHYGTDFVFDGAADRPYAEEDLPNPRSAYGASKLLGEWFALEHPAGYVLRVESLFGIPGSGRTRQGSLGTIVRRIKAGQSVPVFVDRTVSPTYTADVARATRALILQRAAPGLYHCVNSGAATWADVASEVARQLRATARLEPISLETAALKAPRPRYCALSNRKLIAAGIAMPPWQDALVRFLTELAAQQGDLDV